MKKTIFFLAASLLIFSTIPAFCQENADAITTIFIVRHAEKAAQPVDNPPLTEEGEKRAETLAKLLKDTDLSAIFSTNTTRTIETVNNSAAGHGIEVTLYASVQELLHALESQHSGKTVLVAGHSNTIPWIIRALGVKTVPHIGDDQYSSIFIVSSTARGETTLNTINYEIF